MRAFLLTPREEFVTAENLDRAYEWHHLNIGFGVTITGPHTVARMTNTLEIKRGDKVLEIGTGSGYQSAYLSNLTPNVWSIEIIPALAKRTRALYDSLIARGYSEYRAIRTRNADGYYGWAGECAVRQDHRHLRHRSHPPAAAAATHAGRDHGHSGRAARRAACAEGGQAAVAGRPNVCRPLRYLWRRDHSVRAVHGLSPVVRRLRAHQLEPIRIPAASTSAPPIITFAAAETGGVSMYRHWIQEIASSSIRPRRRRRPSPCRTPGSGRAGCGRCRPPWSSVRRRAPRRSGEPRPESLPSSDERFCKAHRNAGADRSREPDEERVP